jgi:hypothetical protein
MYPRVRKVVEAYQKGGLEGMKLYFDQPDMQIDPSTWCGYIKKSLDDGHTVSLDMELQLMLEKFNNYKDVSEKNKGAGSNTNVGEGNTEVEG